MPITRETIEKAYGGNFVGGNKMEIFPNGREGFREILEGIQKAKEMVVVNIFVLRNDATGIALTDLLTQKAHEGIRVHLLYDNLASWRTPERFWKKLRAAGIIALSSHPFTWRNPFSYFHRDHRKLVIIDGSVAFLGSLNMNNHALTLRNTVVRIEGPVVREIEKRFNTTWLRWGGSSILGPVRAMRPYKAGVLMMPVFSSSAHQHQQIMHLFNWFLEHAERTIDLTTPFFIPTPRMAALLVAAVQRGVRVRLLLPLHNEVRAVGYASMASFVPLDELGVEVYLYRTRMLHAKTYTFDGACTLVGSVNLDYESLTANDESNVAICDARAVRRFTGIFENDLRHADAVRLHEWLVLPWRKRMLEIFFSFFRKRL